MADKIVDLSDRKLVYCGVCGSKLEIELGKRLNYDEEDGREWLRAIKRCPNQRWFNMHTFVKGVAGYSPKYDAIVCSFDM